MPPPKDQAEGEQAADLSPVLGACHVTEVERIHAWFRTLVLGADRDRSPRQYRVREARC